MPELSERANAPGGVEARLLAVIEASPSGMIVVDANGRIVLVNREVEQRFGYSRAELLGQSVEVLVPVRVRSEHVADRAGFGRHPVPRPMGAGRDLVGVGKDGREFPVEVGLSPLRTAEGDFVIASVVDITERKRAEEALKRSNEDLERFAYVASHDLQEPLRMVASYVELLAERYRGRLDADADDFIGFALDGAHRMQRLIADLLAFSRVTRGSGVFERVNAGAVLESVLADLRLAIEESAAEITAEGLPEVLADPGQLAHLFQNLVSNALKFRGTAAPRVRISAEWDGERWVFAVSDNGIGMDPQYFDRIFVIFQRLHGRDAYPGTGMGLAIAKKIVERHGGRIWVESQVGRGTTFRFTLPAIAEG